MTPGRCSKETFWDRPKHECRPCEEKYYIKKGHEFSSNCGWSDEQHQSMPVYIECAPGTFNDGSFVRCQRCLLCPETLTSAFACTTTSNAICCKQGERILNSKCIPQPFISTTWSTTDTTIAATTVADWNHSPNTTESNHQTTVPQQTWSGSSTLTPQTPNTSVTAAYVSLGIIPAFLLVCLLLVIRRKRAPGFKEDFQKWCNGAVRKKGTDRLQQSVSYSIINETGNSELSTVYSQLIAPEVLSAPLRSVLNNLDVLEELVLVLDPDISGAKNTRHLASQCSFSFAWINYAYSMKDHKSPFVAVLEGVVTKNPDWTVNHLAELLTSIGRNDAVEILTKIPAAAD
ncbi:hypothetical protein DNTS_026242 [Danionella cerebrum]|uniref:TNFR-Cys domain-containing protein n=1 Tax=Danionella cerebrum TaxID=2873325 RepID=A0A553QMY6_9TELE|nr:hypothetical protein DNTS_026242 [Danionella translucida]